MLKKGLYSITAPFQSYLGEAWWYSISSKDDQSNLSLCKTKKFFLLQLQDPDEKHSIENLVPKLDMTSPLILFLQRE